MSNENIVVNNNKNQHEAVKSKVILVDDLDGDEKDVVIPVVQKKRVKVLAKKNHKCILFGDHIVLTKNEISYVTPEAKAVLAKSPLDLLKPL